jgi:hypothetical protein
MPASLPQFVTLTGVDHPRHIPGMLELTRDYPGRVEWALLLSTQRMGQPGYLGWWKIMEILKRCKECPRDLVPLPRLALHVCGGLARDFAMGEGDPQALSGWLTQFNRVQFNLEPGWWQELCAKDAQAERRLVAFANAYNLDVVLQTRGAFPAPLGRPLTRVFWLYDCSGGTGERPRCWPRYADSHLVGYAGGISPENVREVITDISDVGPYWLDSESGLRDQDNQFDLGRCRQLLAAVYPG